MVTRDNKRESFGKEKPHVAVKVSLHNEPKISMVGALKRQEEYLSDHSDDQEEEVADKKTFKAPIAPYSSKHQVSTHSNAKQKVINIDLEEHAEKINFNSDSEEEAPTAKNNPAKPQVFPKAVEKKSKWDEE
jgi:hypothetical protein